MEGSHVPEPNETQTTRSSKNDQEMTVAMCPTPYLVAQEETKAHLLYPPPYRYVTLGKLA